MKNNKRILRFFDPIHSIYYVVVLGDIGLFREIIYQHDKEYKIDNVCGHFCCCSDRFFIYVNRLDCGLIAHESIHATLAMFERIGSRLDRSSEENFAYYTQWIVGTILYNFKREKKK